MEEGLSTSLTESICTAVAFETNEYGRLIAATLEEKDFAEPHKTIFVKCKEYRQKYNRPPGTAHLDDLLYDKLESKNQQQVNLFSRLLLGMLTQWENGINSEFIYSRVAEYKRKNVLRVGVETAANRYIQGGDNTIEDVERILLDTVNKKVELEDPGTFFNDKQSLFNLFNEERNDYFTLGIKPLDRKEICPTKKELFLFIAARKRGKSFLVTHCGKRSLMQGWKVLHVTLEMNEQSVQKRYIQGFYSFTKRDEEYRLPQMRVDEKGIIIDLDIPKLVKAKSHLQDPKTQSKLLKDWDKWKYFGNLVIKAFPTGQLTIHQLEAYLDGLEITKGFVPDCLIVDYPDLMKIDMREPIFSLGRLFVDLRGIAVKRNLAIITPTQANREGEKESEVRSHQVAGDISKVATADTVLTYSQTEYEKRLGFARIFVNNARNEEDGFTVIISQAYAIGQFALESGYMPNDYKSQMDTLKSQLKSN